MNAIKHAEATGIGLRLQSKNNELIIRVEDDGIGFDASNLGANERKNRGFGLPNIHERLKYLGGSIDIRSQPNHGTNVIISIPCRNNKD
jgi:NarL family two-component system sensor histidine kinase LiaS